MALWGIPPAPDEADPSACPSPLSLAAAGACIHPACLPAACLALQAEVRALAKKMLRRRVKDDIIEAAYNKHAL